MNNLQLSITQHQNYVYPNAVDGITTMKRKIIAVKWQPFAHNRVLLSTVNKMESYYCSYLLKHIE